MWTGSGQTVWLISTNLLEFQSFIFKVSQKNTYSFSKLFSKPELTSNQAWSFHRLIDINLCGAVLWTHVTLSPPFSFVDWAWSLGLQLRQPAIEYIDRLKDWLKDLGRLYCDSFWLFQNILLCVCQNLHCFLDSINSFSSGLTRATNCSYASSAWEEVEVYQQMRNAKTRIGLVLTANIVVYWLLPTLTCVEILETALIKYCCVLVQQLPSSAERWAPSIQVVSFTY